ncbi:hypothetical protein [Nocardioides sp.]|uniref:hypothetical protein n=1 Tax=Nocardioides sp. TaxID=35761 RepID=UPI002637E2BD|nr:hypothetical protein [Nocardioides sp.]
MGDLLTTGSVLAAFFAGGVALFAPCCVAFTVMGGFVIYLANTGQMTGGPGFQVSIGKGLSEVLARIETWTDPVPEPVLGLAVLALAAVFVIATLRDRQRPDASTDAEPDEDPACHGPGVGAHPDNHS